MISPFDRLAALHRHLAALEAERERLEAAVQAGLSPEREEGKEITALHRRWLTATGNRLPWPNIRGSGSCMSWMLGLPPTMTSTFPAALASCGTPWFIGQNKDERGPGLRSVSSQ